MFSKKLNIIIFLICILGISLFFSNTSYENFKGERQMEIHPTGNWNKNCKWIEEELYGLKAHCQKKKKGTKKKEWNSNFLPYQECESETQPNGDIFVPIKNDNGTLKCAKYRPKQPEEESD